MLIGSFDSINPDSKIIVGYKNTSDTFLPSFTPIFGLGKLHLFNLFHR